ncbi:hypothetical protein D9V32_05555 [Mycetocola tolaasinivorans]|uniref:Uncharacterized protein n=1 Tax=Mycetocola tolaasinivorans TaxID=76635 RepID=A0A3L7A7J8_9MICO|nr:hypothetical protein [Mycetocola tolaasinivorans]RLP76336.1 hypothetical protein D9V32_05555 [Mycetocola tolaasinivorans]
MPYKPTITAYTDAAPCPHVEVFFPSFAPGTVTVTVRRTAGKDTHDLRGAVRARVAGALTKIDFEVPFGVATQYRAQMFNAAGASLGWTDPGWVTVRETATWLHNPLNPQGAVKVQFRGSALQGISRPLQGEIVQPIGRPKGMLITSGRSGVTSAVLDVITDDLDSADKVQALLGSAAQPLGGVLCFRTGATDRVRIPQPFYAAVMDIEEVDFDYALGGTKIAHHMTGTEASPPAAGIFVPLLTRRHLNAFFSTRAAFNAAYPSRIAANRDYRKAQ